MFGAGGGLSPLESGVRLDVLELPRYQRGGRRISQQVEARDPVGIRNNQLGQDLDRDIATELGVLRAIDLTHSAQAEERDDFIGAKATTGGERHSCLLSSADYTVRSCAAPQRDNVAPSESNVGLSEF